MISTSGSTVLFTLACMMSKKKRAASINKVFRLLQTVFPIFMTLCMITPSIASAERAALIIKFGDIDKTPTDKLFFDYDYASMACQKDIDMLEEELIEYQPVQRKLRRLATKYGEDFSEVRNYYQENLTAYQRAEDTEFLFFSKLIGRSCAYLEKKGYFGKR